MVTILPPPPPKQPSFLESLGIGIADEVKNIPQRLQGMQAREELAKRKKQYSELTGMDLSSANEQDLSKAFESFMNHKNQIQVEKLKGENSLALEELRGQKTNSKEDAKKQEEIDQVEAALSSLKRMKALRKNGRLGFASGFAGAFSPETRKDRGEYSRLGRSLIAYATPIIIRNKVEFEALAEDLYDPNITDAEAEGILDGMEKIIRDNLSAKSGNREQPQSPSKEKRPIGAFER